MNKTLFLILGILFTVSCSDEYDPIGKWDDNIKLSTKIADFKSTADSITITTEGDYWWINNISFEDTNYVYRNRKDINLETDSFYIQENNFIVERRDKNSLFIKIYDNNTRVKRVMSISFQAGDYFDYVYINQAAK